MFSIEDKINFMSFLVSIFLIFYSLFRDNMDVLELTLNNVYYTMQVIVAFVNVRKIKLMH